MKILLITVCHNEEYLLPYFLDYYTSFCDKIVIFDGGSTDQSHSIIQPYIATGKVELRVEHNESLDERHLMHIRNNGYKQVSNWESYDWVIVCDVDEFLYHPGTIRGKLQELQISGVWRPTIQGFQAYSTVLPTFTPNNYIFNQINQGFYLQSLCKYCIFSPKHININYDWGCHTAQSSTVINDEYPCPRPIHPDPTPPVEHIRNLHFRYLSHSYLTELTKKKGSRLSSFNRNNRYGIHYDDQCAISVDEYNKIPHTFSFHYTPSLTNVSQDFFERIKQPIASTANPLWKEKFSTECHSLMNIFGWTTLNSLRFIRALGRFQHALNITGDVGEIGVFQGRVSIFLHCLLNDTEKVYAIDNFDEWAQNKTIYFGKYNKEVFIANCKQFHTDFNRMVIVTGSAIEHKQSLPGSMYSYISIFWV